MWRKNPNFERYHLEQEEVVKYLRRAIPPVHLYKLNADGEGLVGYKFVLFRIFWGAKCLSRWEPREIAAVETPQLQRWKQLNGTPGRALWLSNVLVDIGSLSNQCRKFLLQDTTDGACVYVSDQFLRLFSSSIYELKEDLIYELVDGTVVRVLRKDTRLVLAYFAIVKGDGIVEEHTLPLSLMLGDGSLEHHSENVAKWEFSKGLLEKSVPKTSASMLQPNKLVPPSAQAQR